MQNPLLALFYAGFCDANNNAITFVLFSCRAMPSTSKSESLIRECELLPDQAEALSKGKRFQFYAKALPEDVLEAAVTGALALRQDIHDHEYSALIYRLGLDVRYMLYDDALDFDSDKHAKKWALAVGLGLVLERLRRRGKIKQIPTDPFSDVQMALALGQVADDLFPELA